MNRANFNAAKGQFQARLRARNFPLDEEWLTVTAEAVCWTLGCRFYGKRIRFEDAGVNMDDLYRLYCGACGQVTWDIYLLHDDGEEHVEQAHEGLRPTG